MTKLPKVILRLMAPCILLIGVAEAEDLDRHAICNDLSDDIVKELSGGTNPKDYRLFSVDSFYSEKLDTCVHVEASLFSPDVTVRDMARSVITDDPRKYPPLLLHCDVDGVDEANIEVVRELKGRVFEVPYRQWLTDGQGGPPRTLNTPDRPYSRADCEQALDRWLNSWR